ncbi:MAG TPA: DUF2914 domain-containing protein [Myxococcales bacterium]|jgi:hypothetical protein|nr:DUF2914 domain-containing protein [Myxococcales bacterium]
MKLLWLMLWVLPALALAEEPKPAAAAGGSGVEIVDAKIATGVTNREPDGAGTSFKADVGKLYCWMKVKGPEGSKVTAAWFKGDEEMGKVELELKHATMRTWSSKTITPEMKGDWRVDIMGPDGTVLQTLKFTVEG